MKKKKTVKTFEPQTHSTKEETTLMVMHHFSLSLHLFCLSLFKTIYSPHPTVRRSALLLCCFFFSLYCFPSYLILYVYDIVVAVVVVLSFLTLIAFVLARQMVRRSHIKNGLCAVRLTRKFHGNGAKAPITTTTTENDEQKR